MAKKQLPRGIRNNNPGNLEYNPNTKWQGLAEPPVEPENRFCRFKDATYGIRAIARTLITYGDKYGCNTVRQIVNRWAPAMENNVSSYVRAVCGDCGFQPDEVLDVHDYATLRALVVAIIRHENGQQPYSDAQIDKGLVLAGVEPPRKPLAQSRTVAGSAVAGTAVLASEVVTEVKDQVEPLVPYADSLKLLFLLVALVGIGLTVWARIDDRRRGLR